MQDFSRRFPSLLVLAGIALLLMGADNQVKSIDIGSVISGMTNSAISGRCWGRRSSTSRGRRRSSSRCSGQMPPASRRSWA